MVSNNFLAQNNDVPSQILQFSKFFKAVKQDVDKRLKPTKNSSKYINFQKIAKNHSDPKKATANRQWTIATRKRAKIAAKT